MFDTLSDSNEMEYKNGWKQRKNNTEAEEEKNYNTNSIFNVYLFARKRELQNDPISISFSLLHK